MRLLQIPANYISGEQNYNLNAMAPLTNKQASAHKPINRPHHSNMHGVFERAGPGQDPVAAEGQQMRWAVNKTFPW